MEMFVASVLVEELVFENDWMTSSSEFGENVVVYASNEIEAYEKIEGHYPSSDDAERRLITVKFWPVIK